MSDSEQAPDGPTPFSDAPSREDVMNLLEDALDESHRKATEGRVYDAENERVRQGWLKTFGYLAGQYRQLRKDADLEALQARVEELEQQGDE